MFFLLSHLLLFFLYLSYQNSVIFFLYIFLSFFLLYFFRIFYYFFLSFSVFFFIQCTLRPSGILVILAFFPSNYLSFLIICIKLLGVHFDDYLIVLINMLITCVLHFLKQSSTYIKHASNKLSLKSVKSLYYALVHPYLLYSIKGTVHARFSTSWFFTIRTNGLKYQNFSWKKSTPRGIPGE